MSGGTLNKVILIGRLGQDPELKYTNTQKAVATFSVATNEYWTDKDGNKQESAEWHRIVVWEKTAEFVSEWVKKGSLVYIEGRLQTRSWEGQDGIKRYTTEVVSRDIQLLGSKSQGNYGVPTPDDNSAPPQKSSAPQSQENTPNKPKRKFEETDSNETKPSNESDPNDDLPF